MIPACLVTAGGGGIFLAGRALKPVDTISQTALEMEESDLSRRIDVKTKDELGRLALTLNQMIGRLEKVLSWIQYCPTPCTKVMPALIAADRLICNNALWQN
ncbi:MAG: HAMP domain-containing protein [Dehalococcoidia bacterium]